MSENIYLVGFMGCGKTSVGRLTAEKIGRPFFDMDAEIVKRLDKPIADVFTQDGEEAFRDAETDILISLARKERIVAATGGGTPSRARNREIMKKSGRMVYLQTSLSDCRRRIQAEEDLVRPLWTDDARIGRLYEEREPFYEESDVILDIREKTPDEIAEALVNRLVPEERFVASYGDTGVRILVTRRGPAATVEQLNGRRCVILTDSNVAGRHLAEYLNVLGDVPVITVKAGERSKSLNHARKVYEQLLGHHIDRGDVLIALGGGVITDLGAFIASTYKRGMGLILVSTTLLGCVDAAVGGKAAVNLGPAKNVVGCFSTPQSVVLDLETLRTLSAADIREGLIEAYKTGLVASGELFGLVHAAAKPLLNGDKVLLAQLVSLSARAKAEVVARDFTESGSRAILNYGHTVGHAIESINNFRVRHGRAVALGLQAATEISAGRGMLPRKTADGIVRTVRSMFPSLPKFPAADRIWRMMLHDKKIRGGVPAFVLLRGIGDPVIVKDVAEVELEAALQRLTGDRDG